MFYIVCSLFYLYCFWESKHQDSQRYRRQDVVWGWDRVEYKYGIAHLNLIFLVFYKGNTSLADNNSPTESETEKKEKSEHGYIKYYIPGGPLSLSKGINSGKSSYKPSESNGGPVLLVTGSKCGSSSTSTFSSTGGPVSLKTGSK